MKTIILGREKPTKLGIVEDEKGEKKELLYQPFSHKPTQTGVSHKHATITIDDNGCWCLEDRWSTNGTYIREDDGSFRRIGDSRHPGNCRITPMTFVKLGIDDTTCCCFYAKQAEKFGNFDEEFEFIEKKMDELSEFEKKSKSNIKIVSNLIEFVLPTILLLIIFLFFKPYIKGEGVLAALLGGGATLVMIFSRMAKSIYSPQEKKKEVERKTKEIKKVVSSCPNPLCNHILSDSEIKMMRCQSCNIQHN